jgi:hypothetical protein
VRATVDQYGMRLQLQARIEAAAEAAAVMAGTERTVSRKIKKRIRWKRTSRRKTESRCSSSCRKIHCLPVSSDRIVQGPVATQSPTERRPIFFFVEVRRSRNRGWKLRVNLRNAQVGGRAYVRRVEDKRKQQQLIPDKKTTQGAQLSKAKQRARRCDVMLLMGGINWM